ncbi:MAG: hypothetical protein Kow00108_08780 [Calditrichia bacterium]
MLQPKRNKILSEGKSWAIYINIGMSIVAAMLFWIFLGYWLDKKMGTSPLFILIGIGFALLSVGYEIYKLVRMTEDGKK